MAGPNVHQLTEMTATPANADELYIVDVSGMVDRKISYDTLKGPTSTKTADYTITKNREKVFVTGNVTITMPAASFAWEEKVFNIGTGQVTLAPQGSDTIEGQESFIIGGQYEGVSLEGDGGTLWVRS